MRYLIKILFFLFTGMVCYGYYHKSMVNYDAGDKWIGLGIIGGAFILMPIFIYHRWKGRDVKEYMLTEDAIKRMNDFNNDTSSVKTPDKTE